MSKSFGKGSNTTKKTEHNSSAFQPTAYDKNSLEVEDGKEEQVDNAGDSLFEDMFLVGNAANRKNEKAPNSQSTEEIEPKLSKEVTARLKEKDVLPAIVKQRYALLSSLSLSLCVCVYCDVMCQKTVMRLSGFLLSASLQSQ